MYRFRQVDKALRQIGSYPTRISEIKRGMKKESHNTSTSIVSRTPVQLSR